MNNYRDCKDPALDFMWEDMTNYIGQKERFIGCFKSHSRAKNVNGIMETFEVLFDELVQNIFEEINHQLEQYSRDCLFPQR
jgi:hypothetical protein